MACPGPMLSLGLCLELVLRLSLGGGCAEACGWPVAWAELDSGVGAELGWALALGLPEACGWPVAWAEL